MREKPTSAYTNMYNYFIINSVSSYMFQPPTVAIFMEAFFEGYTRCDPKVLRQAILKECCALHLAADTITTYDYASCNM
jgi:hypothetical protein